MKIAEESSIFSQKTPALIARETKPFPAENDDRLKALAATAHDRGVKFLSNEFAYLRRKIDPALAQRDRPYRMIEGFSGGG